MPLSLLYCFSSKPLKLRFNEALLIAIGGIIRGAIAFGLSLSIQTEHKEILKTTTQILVLMTTILLGSTMGLIAKCLKIGVGNTSIEDEDQYKGKKGMN